jgi:hypothetical protein
MECPDTWGKWTTNKAAHALDLDLGEEARRRLYGKLWGFIAADYAAGTPTPPDKAPHWWDRLDTHEQEALTRAVSAW